MREGRRYLRFFRKDLGWTAFWIGLFWLMGEVLVAILMLVAFREEQSYGCMGGMLAIMGLAVGMLTQNGVSGYVAFRMSVAMGGTRRSYILWSLVMGLAEGAIGAVLVWLLIQLERWSLAALLPGWTNDFDVGAAVRFWYLLVGVVAVAAVQLLLTGVMNRFGLKAFRWAWIIFWLGLMFVSQAVSQAADGAANVLGRIGAALIRFGTTIGPIGWSCVGAAVFLACLGFGVGLLRKAEVQL